MNKTESAIREIIENVIVWIIMIVLLLGAIPILVVKVQKQRATPAAIERPHLPSLCAQYYNDDSEAWNDCMGVGKK